ncbi:sunset domain-containing protein [Arthrobacter sp. RAF14]|uniref:sunset domain-containing protein n=1 Tax=Arthrobacter sp. RAF14 TaxID=3233051 RepID=UPI003F91B4E6
MSIKSLGRAVIAALTALLAVVASLVVAAPAQAAPTVATRVASYAAGPATVTRGKPITVQGQAQRLNGRTWANTGTVKAVVYFDPDGAKPNAAVRTVNSNTKGFVRTSFTASVSGKWTLRIVSTGTLKASSTGQRYVRVVAPPRPTRPTSAAPISKLNCPAWAPIKGNQGRPEWIYHLPGQRSYNVTAPEACFSTEGAAQRAGYRRARN